MKFIKHTVIDMDESMVQRCVICGESISDYRTAMYTGAAPKGFAAGGVYVSDGNPRIYQTAEPENFIECKNFKPIIHQGFV